MNAIQAQQANQLLSALLDSQNPIPSLVDHPDYQALLTESGKHQRADWAAHMSPSLAPYSLLGMQLAALHGGNLLSPALYPALKQAETETLRWLCQLFHQTHAHFTHGGSYANLEALWKAREHAKTARTRVYASTASHYSITKACQILGLDLVLLETDQQGRIKLDDLEAACDAEPPLAVVFNMGTTGTGVIDELHAGINIAKRFKAWTHIDAAWGGALMCLPIYSTSFDYFTRADSISFDPHKSLFQPKPSSVVLYQHPASPVIPSPDYLDASPLHMLPGSYGGELFIPLWLNLLLLGSDWFTQQVKTRLAEAQKFAEKLIGLGWPVIQSETGIICFQIPRDRDLSKLVEQGVFSMLEVKQNTYYRAVFANQYTTAESLIKALSPAL